MSVRRVTIITCDRCGHRQEFADAKQARAQSHWHRSKGTDVCGHCFRRDNAAVQA